MPYTNIWIVDDPIMNKSIIDLKTEQVYDKLATVNGQPLLVSSFNIAVHDCIVPQDVLERRMVQALAKNDRTLYFVNWNQSVVVYRKAI